MKNTQCSDGCTFEAASTFSLESPLPPLPKPIATRVVLNLGKGVPSHYANLSDDSFQPHVFRRESSFPFPPGFLPEGCYFIRLMPTSPYTPPRFQYEGTIRVQRFGDTTIASGDLYNKDVCVSFPIKNDGTANVPVFPRKDYAYYLSVTGIEGEQETGNILLELEPHYFNQFNQTWSKRVPLKAVLKFSTEPGNIHYWRGEILTHSGIVLGYMIFVFVSPFLRQAIIEIDRVATAPLPIDRKKDRWRSVFKKACWDVVVEISDDDVEETDGIIWSHEKLHEKMLKYRQSADLDTQWRYHLLVVGKLSGGDFGAMYDNTVNGINGNPREGAAISYLESFPDDLCWGKCRGKPFGKFLDPYIRTAIHEIGHAMNLYHPDNHNENHIMQKTLHVARNADPQKQFPDNIEWSFSSQDVHLLCHLPDIVLRPGGVWFGTDHRRLPVSAGVGCLY